MRPASSVTFTDQPRQSTPSSRTAALWMSSMAWRWAAAKSLNSLPSVSRMSLRLVASGEREHLSGGGAPTKTELRPSSLSGAHSSSSESFSPSSRNATLVSSTFCGETPSAGATSTRSVSFKPAVAANFESTFV